MKNLLLFLFIILIIGTISVVIYVSGNDEAPTRTITNTIEHEALK